MVKTVRDLNEGFMMAPAGITSDYIAEVSDNGNCKDFLEYSSWSTKLCLVTVKYQDYDAFSIVYHPRFLPKKDIFFIIARDMFPLLILISLITTLIEGRLALAPVPCAVCVCVCVCVCVW
eukprot:GHVR01165260.1.p1 GENE.GHVR01165260.1~~GHVR01165260.1.p1  ORF type:complete len:120 (-),score=16.65 GHVR01165260.1:358-717(-)